jgi:hypothetical protein
MYGISDEVIALAEFVAHSFGEAECLVEVLEFVAQVLVSIINEYEGAVGVLNANLWLERRSKDFGEECFVHSDCWFVG